MRRDRLLIVSIALAVIAWIVGRRMQGGTLPQWSAPEYPTFSPEFAAPDANLAQPAAYDIGMLTDDTDLGDGAASAAMPEADAALTEQMLVDAPDASGMAADALAAIDVDEAVVLDDSAADDDAVTVSPVEDVPGISTTDLADQADAALADHAAALSASAESTTDATGASPPDDLIVIEGIGPKISAIMQAQGITTFAQLAEADPAQIGTMLRSAGITTANPTTWADQARLAMHGDWDGLKELQGRIKNGRLES